MHKREKNEKKNRRLQLAYLGAPASGNSTGCEPLSTLAIMVGSQPDGIATVSAVHQQAYSDAKVYNLVSSNRLQLLKRWITLSAR